MEEVKSAKEEIKEAIEALKVVAKCGKAVMADGKVSVADLPALMALVQNQGVLVEGAKGLDHLDLKSLGLDEAVEIIVSLVQAIKEVKAA